MNIDEYEFGKFGDLKKDFLEAYSTEVLTKEKASAKVGRTSQTIRNWQQDDPEFDDAVEKAQSEQEDLRLQKIEDSVFQQIMKGEAAASLTIFFLKNLGNGKWLDSKVIEEQFEGEIEHKGGFDIRDLHDLADQYKSEDE